MVAVAGERRLVTDDAADSEGAGVLEETLMMVSNPESAEMAVRAAVACSEKIESAAVLELSMARLQCCQRGNPASCIVPWAADRLERIRGMQRPCETFVACVLAEWQQSQLTGYRAASRAPRLHPQGVAPLPHRCESL